MEIELYAARRVSEVIAGLSLASRARVLNLVAQHNSEEAERTAKAEFDKRQLSLGPVVNGHHERLAKAAAELL
jgi:hypothetical protein